MIRHNTEYLVPDVARQHSGLIFKGKNAQEECWLADGCMNIWGGCNHGLAERKD